MTARRKTASELRSARWFAPDDLRAFGHRSRFMQMGYGPEDWVGRPVVAIINTWSDINPCHAHFKHRVEDIKHGILQAGGLPLELPALSLSESYVKPTTMLYRNMLAMDVEELLRCHPVDGAVLMGGCDKTTPALLMGATSAGFPCIFVPAGPMLRGNWKGKVLGSGSDAWKYWDERRAGEITDQDWVNIEAGIARSDGHCMTMGTASTMTAIAEAIGMTLPGASSIPAADANHIRMCAASGRRIVEMIWEDLTPNRIQTRPAFENAIRVAMAMGCSTNAIIHVIAQARRAGCEIGLADFEAASHLPVIANVRPSGERYLMEDFYYAGGLKGLMLRMKQHLNLDALTVTGRSLGENLADAAVYDEDVIRSLDNPGLCRWGAGRAEGQSGARRLRHQAQRLRAPSFEACRPGPGLRQLSRDEGGDRSRRSRCHPRPCPGPAQCRSPGWPRHAGMGHAADPQEAGEAGGARHGADFRCPHERHQLWRLHPACGAGSLYRRPFGAGADRRCHLDRRRPALDPASMSPRPSSPAAVPAGCSRRRASSVAMAGCSCAISVRPMTAATSTSCSAISARLPASPTSFDRSE